MKTLDFSNATAVKFKAPLSGDSPYAGQTLFVAGQDNVLGPGRKLTDGSRGPRGQYFVANVRVGAGADAPTYRWEVSRKKYLQLREGQPITVFVNNPDDPAKALYLGVLTNVPADIPAGSR